MTVNIKVFNDINQLYEEVASYYVEKINQNPNICLGLATGSTPIMLYQKLIMAYKDQKISFKQVRTFNLDEYIGLHQNHKQSYYTFMKEQLFKHIDIQDDHTFIPRGDMNDDIKAIKTYQNLLDKNKIDIQLLGIGANGHIGFNEPGTDFESKTHVVKLAAKTRSDNARLFNHLDEVPTHAITMGIKEIMGAKEIIVIAVGQNKKDAVYEMIYGDININLPASILQKHPNVSIYLDEAAASKFQKGE